MAELGILQLLICDYIVAVGSIIMETLRRHVGIIVSSMKWMCIEDELFFKRVN